MKAGKITDIVYIYIAINRFIGYRDRPTYQYFVRCQWLTRRPNWVSEGRLGVQKSQRSLLCQSRLEYKEKKKMEKLLRLDVSLLKLLRTYPTSATTKEINKETAAAPVVLKTNVFPMSTIVQTRTFKNISRPFTHSLAHRCRKIIAAALVTVLFFFF